MTGEVETFDPPLFQTWVMFLGMMFALPAHFVSEWYKVYKLQANPAALAELRAEQAKVCAQRPPHEPAAPRTPIPASSLHPANLLLTLTHPTLPTGPSPTQPFHVTHRHAPRPRPQVPALHPNLASSQVTSKTYMLLAIPSFFDLLATVTRYNPNVPLPTLTRHPPSPSPPPSPTPRLRLQPPPAITRS